MLVDSFLICCREFYSLTQSYDFAKAIGFALRPFCQYSNWRHFSNIRCFFERFGAYNNYNLGVDSFLRCFRQLYCLTQSYDFARAIGFALRPFLPNIQIGVISRILGVFSSGLVHIITIMWL